MRFRGVVTLNGKTATGIEVPTEVVTGLGSSKRPPVRVTINGYTYRSSIASMGGRFLLSVSAEVRAKAGVAANDEVDVDVELDTEQRIVTVFTPTPSGGPTPSGPTDLATALEQNAAARRAFDGMSYSRQLRYVLSVEGAKTPETRQRRIDKAIDELSA